jgi:hypothetical protein
MRRPKCFVVVLPAAFGPAMMSMCGSVELTMVALMQAGGR